MLPNDLNNRIVFLDGAMGTVLQQKGLPPGGRPELFNLTDPDLLSSVYRDYIAAGSQIIYANTFGANGLKLAPTGHSVEEIVGAAVAVAKKAALLAVKENTDLPVFVTMSFDGSGRTFTGCTVVSMALPPGRCADHRGTDRLYR